MGDRYYLILNCAYCNEENDNIYYAPTSMFYDFKCKKCNKINFISITSGIEAKKAEDVKLQDVIDAFSSTTSSNLSKEEIKRECEYYMKQLKKDMKKEKEYEREKNNKTKN